MASIPVFRRHYFISLGVIAIGLVSSFFLAGFLLSLQRERERGQDHIFHSPAFMFRSLILASEMDPEMAIKAMDQTSPPDEMFHLEYLAENSPRLTELKAIDRDKLKRNEPVVVHRAEGGPPREVILSLSPKSGALLTQSKNDGPPGSGPRGRHGLMAHGPPSFLWFTLACLFASVVVTTGIAIKLLFASYKNRAASAAVILSELKAGNLAARMPVEKMDELSDLVLSFNHMADEIQTLVNRLRQTEASRMEMLQSLAHDLRTPIASMKTFLESLREHGDRLSAEQKSKALDFCLAENTYFERLVEDLLLLASVGEPKFSPDADRVNLAQLLRLLVETLDSRSGHVRLHFRTSEKPGPMIKGDQPLLERMFRNGLENALSFAKSRVDVVLEWDGLNYRVQILDDGPGLDAEALREFGTKRKSRKVQRVNATRVSSGIGSVIIRQIVTAHGGSVEIRNVQSAGVVSGAALEFRLTI